MCKCSHSRKSIVETEKTLRNRFKWLIQHGKSNAGMNFTVFDRSTQSNELVDNLWPERNQLKWFIVKTKRMKTKLMDRYPEIRQSLNRQSKAPIWIETELREPGEDIPTCCIFNGLQIRPSCGCRIHAVSLILAKHFWLNTVPNVINQIIGCRTQLQRLKSSLQQNTIVICDSQSAIAISCNPKSAAPPVPSKLEYQLADMFTKPVPEKVFQYSSITNSYALSWKPCQGDSLNLPDHRIHKDGDGDASFQLESDSLPHAHAQTTKTYYKHQDSRIMKAQELKTKTSANSDINDNSSEIKLRGRLLESFQDDAKYEHLDEFDLEEMDLKWQVAMISMRMKKFYKKTGRKLQFDAKEPNSGNKDGRRSGKKENSKALLTIDGEGVDWTSHSKEDEDYALMACNIELSDASVEIQAYTQGLKKVEAQFVAHQKGQLWYEEKIRFMKIDLDDKTDVLTYHKKLLAEAQKEKEDLKAKVEKWHNSSKNLGKLLNTQMSANDKFRLGYGDHRYDGILSYENEVLQSVFMNKESELVNQPLYDRFVTAGGMHVVPPPMTGNYMPSGPDVEIDYSQFTYGPKQSQPSESETQTSDFDTCESDSSEPTINEPKVQVKALREIVKNQFINSKSPKVDKKGLGYRFVTKACFVCGSLSHLIRDCDFHEKRMAKQAELNNRLRKKSSQREIRPIWNNVQRVNHQNQFFPTAVLTRTGKILVSTVRTSGTNNVSTARHNFNRQAIPTNAAIKVNTVKPIVNRVRPITIFHKTHSPFSRPFNITTALKTKFSYQKVNTTEVNAVSAVGGRRETTDYSHRALQNKGIVDSRCSRHMSGNKAYLAEYQDFNGGPVAFGGSKGYITGKGGLACLIIKAIIDESNKCHRSLGHVNFKNLNKLVKRNLVRGLPSNIFQNDHTCVAYQKGKQHKASCKAKPVSSISYSLQLLHMDLFGPTSVRSLNHKTYCLVITDDFSRFSWVFFLRTKDETSGILKDFIRQIKNQLNQKIKTIRCDNGTEFKNRDIIEFCGSKGIKREYNNARTPQQNGVAERKNMTLIEAARTMLADSFLPNAFWAEAVSIASYVLNRVLVTKPQNKTPYELITGKIPIISYIRPFGCHVTILNTIDHLGKFEEKSDEGFLIGYSLNSKAFRVYNLKTKRVKENLHINFLENKPNVTGKGPNWLFNLDYITDTMNYQPVRSENQANKTAGLEEANHSAGTQDNINAGNSKMEADPAQDYFVLPIYSSYTSTDKSSEAKNEGEKHTKDTGLKTNEEPVDQEDQAFLEELERLKRQEKEANDAAEVLRKEFAQSTEDLLLQAGAARATSTNTVNTVSTPLSTANPSNVFSTGGPSNPNLTNYADQDDSQIPALEDIYGNSNDGIFTNASYDDEGAVADFTNLESTMNVSPIPTSRIHSIHPTTQILGDPKSAVQTRSKVNKSSGAHAFIRRIVAIQDSRGMDSCRFVLGLNRQEEEIDYDEVFAPVARIKAIRVFLAFASYMGFIVYQMDVKSAFLYGTIDEEVYVSQPPGFIDPKFHKKVYKSPDLVF
ncbi:putative ribonuclease H-like domain-containing protein [Tanacetum coccineum]